MSRVAEQIHTALEEDLPSGWSLATIEDLVGADGVFVDGDWVESKDQDPTGDVRLIQLADIGDGEYRNRSDRFLTHEKALELGRTFLKKGDVLIARMPDPLGRACIFPGDRKKSVTVVDVAIVRSGNGEFNHRWLMYFINAPASRTSVDSLQSGSTRRRISRGNLARISLPVPPREQQNGIVAEIEKQFSRLDEAVATLKRVKANLKRYKAAALKAAAEGKLTEDWRKAHPNVEPASKLLERILAERRAKWKGKGKYKEPAVLETTVLPMLPDGWAWTSLDHLLREPLRNGHSAKASGTGHGLRAFTLSAVTQGDFSERNTKLTVAHRNKVADLWAQPGDIYVERSNTPELVGLARLYKGPARFAFIPDLLIRVRIIAEVSVQFVEVCLLSEQVRRYFHSKAQGISGTMPKIDQSVIEKTPIPLPPVQEQGQIVAEVERRLSVIKELEAAVQANLTRADRLRQAVFSKAFVGALITSL